MMIKKLSFSFLLILFSISAQCFEIPDKPVGYVHDAAHILNENEISDLNVKLSNFDSKTTNQIVVAIFPSLESESLEDISMKLAEKWKIGQKGKDNGVLLTVFVDDRKVRIEVGYGLESVIPDALASRIIEEKIKPHFRENNYYQGLQEATDGLMLACENAYPAEASQPRVWWMTLIVYTIVGMTGLGALVFVGWVLWLLFNLSVGAFKLLAFIPMLFSPQKRQQFLKDSNQNLKNWSQGDIDFIKELLQNVQKYGWKEAFRKMNRGTGSTFSSSGSSSFGSSSSSSSFSGGGGSFGGGGSSGSW